MNGTASNEQKQSSATPKKFLFVTTYGDGLCLAVQLKKEGCPVKFYIKGKHEQDVGEGFVDKVEDWQKHKDWADVIVFDDVGWGEQADKLRKEGKKVVGGSVYTDKIEDDRDFGQEEMKSVGINVLPHWDFTNFDDAIKFVTENPGRYVIKPSGKAQDDKHLLFVGQEEDGKDILQMLSRYKKSWGKYIKMFQLQKFVSGVEVACGAFFNGKEFIAPFNINFEHKKMFPGDIGPATGEMGTSMYWSDKSALFDQTLTKMQQKLAASGYVGYMDINCIVNARGVYPLEFTSRFGYPTIPIQMEGMLSPVGEFLAAIAAGEKYPLRVKKGFQLGVVIAVPPFPFDDPAAFKRYSQDAIIMFKKPIASGLWVCQVKQVEDDWRLAGDAGYVMVVTGAGSTMDDARKEAYNKVKNIMIPNMFYRTDIGKRWSDDSDRLQTWGYL